MRLWLFDAYKIKSSTLKTSLKLLQEEQADTAHHVKNLFEIMTDTIDKLTEAKDRFKFGDLTNKKDILLAISENPTLINQTLSITLNECLFSIGKSATGIREQLEVVKIMPQQIQNAYEEALKYKWCRERDST